MIDPTKVLTGDYVEATDNIFDYAVPGTVFKVIWHRIPGQEQQALGWKIDPKTGGIMGTQSYPLPHDKVNFMPRRKLADLIKSSLRPLEKQQRDMNRQVDLIQSRVRNIENTESREEEEVTLLRATFNFI
jgi:hypothetical protein